VRFCGYNQPKGFQRDFMTPHTRRKIIHYWRRQIRPILILILVFTSFRSTVADWNDVPTGSMKPTIFEGDRIFVNKLAYGLKVPFTTWHLAHWSGPKRGEIVVFYSPEDGIRLVKRVIGVPGDHIVIRDGHLTINGQPLSYTDFTPADLSNIPKDQQRQYRFQMEAIGDHTHVVALKINPPISPDLDGVYDVPADHYFMMGDNRYNSKDSRFFRDPTGQKVPFVPRDQVLGRANRVIFSLDYDDAYLPRKSRFFKGLP
jgi:signal peptidase I